MRCMHPGGSGIPLAFVEGGALQGWSPVEACRQGAFMQADGPCARCPVRQLPSGMVPLEVAAHAGQLTLRVAYKEDGALAEAYHAFRSTGQGPQVRRSGKQTTEAPAGLVDLQHLSQRQRQALGTASAMGYFREGNDMGVDALAAAMGCSRSTAHEHLRRGLDRLLGDIFS